MTLFICAGSVTDFCLFMSYCISGAGLNTVISYFVTFTLHAIISSLKKTFNNVFSKLKFTLQITVSISLSYFHYPILSSWIIHFFATILYKINKFKCCYYHQNLNLLVHVYIWMLWRKLPRCFSLLIEVIVVFVSILKNSKKENKA